MSEYYETQSELLTQLVDGEISAEQSEQLFASLSLDKDLRIEYQEHIAIKETIRKDIEAFTPPVATTNAIFAKLGYASPTGTNSIPKVIAPWSLLMKRAVAPAMLAVVAFLGVANFTDLFNEQDEILNNAQTSVTKFENIAKPSNDFSVNNIAQNNVIEEKKLAKKSKIAIIESKSIDESSPISENSIAKSENNINNNADLQIANSSINSALPLEFSNSIMQSSNVSMYHNSSFVNVPFMGYNQNLSSSENNFSIYLRGFSDLNNGNSIFTSASGSMNLTLGFMIPLKNNFSFGIEAGMHSFMRFSTNELNQISANPEESSVFWITANGRYDLMSVSLFDVNPYMQVSAGGSTLGFIAKSGIGLQYQTENSPLGFSFGYEYSNIWYSLSPDNAEKVNFTTNNSGMVFGLNYKF